LVLALAVLLLILRVLLLVLLPRLLLLLPLLLLLERAQRQLQVAPRVQIVRVEVERVAIALDGAAVVLLLIERVAQVVARRPSERRAGVLAERAEQRRRLIVLAVLVETVGHVEPALGVVGPRVGGPLELGQRLRVVAARVLLAPLSGEARGAQQELVHQPRSPPARRRCRRARGGRAHRRTGRRRCGGRRLGPRAERRAEQKHQRQDERRGGAPCGTGAGGRTAPGPDPGARGLGGRGRLAAEAGQRQHQRQAQRQESRRERDLEALLAPVGVLARQGLLLHPLDRRGQRRQAGVGGREPEGAPAGAPGDLLQGRHVEARDHHFAGGRVVLEAGPASVLVELRHGLAGLG